jgi:hypothetical protein
MVPEVGNFDVKAIFPNAVRAATVFSADFDLIDYMNPGFAILDAIAQGSGITSNIKLQSSPEAIHGSSSYLTTGNADKDLNIATSGKTKLGVQFTQSGARQIKSIALKLKRVGVITAGKILTLTLNADSTGDPGSVLGTAATVLCSSISTSYGWITFTFATPVDLADATVYHIVLTGNYDASDTLYIAWNALTVSSGGNAEDYAPSAWADVATLNLMYYTMQYNFADITSAAFTEVGNAASAQSKVINVTSGRFIRAKNTVAGGSATGAISLSLVLRKKNAT